MTRSRELLRNALTDLFAFLLLICIFTPPLRLLSGSARPVWLAFLLIIPFCAMCAARMVGNLPLFLALHILLAIWPVVMPLDPIMRLMVLLFMIFSALYSVITRIHGEWRFQFSSAVFGILLAAIISIVLEYFKITDVTGSLRLCAFVILACYIVCEHIIRVDDSIDMLKDAARQPVKTTLRHNNVILAPFLLFCGVAAVFSGYVPVNVMLGALWKVVKFILGLLFSLFPNSGGDAAPEPVAPPSGQGFDFRDALPEATPSLFVEILDALLYVAGWVFIVALVVFTVTRAVKFFLGRFYSGRTARDGDLREYIGPALEREKGRIQGEKGRSWFPFFGLSHAEKVRRAYYKKITRHIRRGAGVLKTDTAGDIEQKLLTREDISEITAEYNDARYGGK